MALNKIGALWLRDGKKGKFMAGVLEIEEQEYSVMVFKNNKDGVEKRPDYTINLVVDDEDQQSVPDQTQSTPKQQQQDDDSIPF